MFRFAGFLHDGNTSDRVDAHCTINDVGQVRLETGEGPQRGSLPLDEIRISPRLGSTPRYLNFPGGEMFETADNDQVDAALGHFKRGSGSHLLHILESRKRTVIAAFLTTILCVWAGMWFVLPAVSKKAAFMLPASLNQQLGQQTLTVLDRTIFKPSELPDSRRQQLQDLFKELPRQEGYEYRLVFRSMNRDMANAFALPSGTIILTDGLVNLAENDQQLLAVMAHEAGHVVQRHALRHAIRSSALTLALVFIVGDVGAASDLVLGLPAFLVEMSYARDHEREADAHACEFMRKHGIPPDSLSTILLRMSPEEKSNGGISTYLSTHPETAQRTCSAP